MPCLQFPSLSEYLVVPVQMVCMIISPLPLERELSVMRGHVIGYILASGIAHRLNELFSLFDKPQVTLLQPLCLALAIVRGDACINAFFVCCCHANVH